MFKKILLLMIVILIILGFFYRDTLTRLYHGYQLNKSSQERAKLYLLDNNTQIEDISQKLISDKTIPDDLKKELTNGERKIVIFKYVSDSQNVAGYFSYLTKGEHPLIIFLRGGNGFFGIMRPNNKFSLFKGYNVVGTLYRGNIYGGEDDLGGTDIADVENLIKYFPQIEKFTNKKMKTPYVMMGVSRGAMEMFASLSHSNLVKDNVKCAISISGNLDLNASMKNRVEMKYLFTQQAEKDKAANLDEWLQKRDPVYNVKSLSKSLKVLLLYGLSDEKVSLEEQDNFKKALDKNKITSMLVTIPGANHGFENNFEDLEKFVGQFIQKNC